LYISLILREIVYSVHILPPGEQNGQEMDSTYREIINIEKAGE